MLLEFEAEVDHRETVDVSAARVNAIIKQLQQLFEGGSWQGESFKGKLGDILPDEVFAQPAPGIHSVAEIVWHCIYWRTVVIRHLEGDSGYRDRTVRQLNFRPLEELKTMGWPSLLAQLNDTQDSLVAHLRVRKDSFLREDYTTGYTFDYLLEGVVQHDIYHLGQIGLVRKMLSARS